MFSKLLQRIILVLSSMGLISCGGGLALLLAEGGIGGTGISLGPILAFGSVVVNDVKFETDSASFEVNGDTDATQDDLRLGMVVTVLGDKNEDNVSGTAGVVRYDPILIGSIKDAPADNSFIVLEQTIVVDSRTQYDGVPGDVFGGLKQGDVVEISGLVGEQGVISATFVGLRDETTQSEITAFVSDTAAGSFRIGNLVVLWDGDEEVEVGEYVEVEGTLNNDGNLVASSVEERDPGLSVTDADEVEIEAIATSDCIGLPCTFNLGSVPVQVDANTEIEDGTADQIVAGVRLEAEGSLEGGVLIAREIEFED